MLTETHGNLLNAKTEAVINTVNCVGVMGKGIALQFKQAFPANYEVYRLACEHGDVRLGHMFVFDTGSMIFPRWIINFPTKDHWKGKSKLQDIESGLRDLVRIVRDLRIRSISVPPLGCGNGGLDWSDVWPLIAQAFATLPDVDVHVYPPEGAPKFDTMKVATKRPRMTRGRALVLQLLGLYGAAGYRHSLLEVQKLTYFLQEAGEDLKLQFQKHHYGPYAENVNYVLQRIEGHFIRGYGDRSKDAEIVVLPEGRAEAETFLEHDRQAISELDRVGELIEGFETPYGLELLSTVHWLATRENGIQSAKDALMAVQQWNRRKASLMIEPHVKAAWSQLERLGWLSHRDMRASPPV
jgi:O-acetyl-ADP-ribose deacetylase (regulator of RNase III)